MSEAEGATVEKPRDGKRVLAIGSLILIAAIFSFLNADERIAVNLGFTTLYRLSLVGVVFSVFVLGMLTMFLFGLRHDRAVRDALRSQGYRQSIPIRALSSPRPSSVSAVQPPAGPAPVPPRDDPSSDRYHEPPSLPSHPATPAIDPEIGLPAANRPLYDSDSLTDHHSAHSPRPGSPPDPEPEPPA